MNKKDTGGGVTSEEQIKDTNKSIAEEKDFKSN